MYNGLHDGILNQMNFDCQTDNALYSFGKQDVNEGNVTPSNLGGVPNVLEWGEMYARIRSTNIALANLAKPTFDNTGNIAGRLRGRDVVFAGLFL